MQQRSRIVLVCGLAVGVTSLSKAQQIGPRDSTEISDFMQNSLVAITDLNGDCSISDVDYALAFHQQMSTVFGPGLQPGDLDSDGVVTAADQILAVENMLRTSYGKATVDGSQTVGTSDFQAILSGASTGNLSADVNVDGTAGADDVIAVIPVVGNEIPSDFDFSTAAYQLHEYILAIETHGTGYFMVAGCEPEDHLSGISNTWTPDVPPWWPPNHLLSSSINWNPDPVPHITHNSINDTITPQPDPHSKSTSKTWPPNHTRDTSNTYPPDHSQAYSRYWPPSHTSAASNTWYPDPPDIHDETVSRGYWPGHATDSSGWQEGPPDHQGSITSDWDHGVATSSTQWPPNHDGTVSQGWGPPAVHSQGRSASYPPSHVSDASRTWDGPEYWPPNHTSSMSSDWGEPNDGNWPVFPPDHSWWSTAESVFPVPRWPFAPTQPPSQ
ncbi:MAG: hypothetical protein AAFR76_03640 [Planctomycetota bacterium]